MVAIPVDCVSWGAIDPVARVIPVTVRLQFFVRKAVYEKWLERQGRQPGKQARQEYNKFLNGWVADRKAALEALWTGQSFKCYTLKLTLETRAVDSRADVAYDALDIEIDPLADNCVTYSTLQDSKRSLSDNPKDRLQPLRGSDKIGSKWRAEGTVGEFAHEIGHILGLDHGYVDTKGHKDYGKLRPNHIADLMYSPEYPISASMITRLIRRSGKNYESQIKCPLSFDVEPSSLNLFLGSLNDLQIHAYTCDYFPPTQDVKSSPAGVIKFTGTCSASGEYLTQLLPSSPLSAGGSAVLPITFELKPRAQELQPLSQDDPFRPKPEKLRIEIAPAVYIEGWYIWHAKLGMPVMRGALTINGFSSSAFFPGPPLWGWFSHGAEECQKRNTWP